LRNKIIEILFFRVEIPIVKNRIPTCRFAVRNKNKFFIDENGIGKTYHIIIQKLFFEGVFEIFKQLLRSHSGYLLGPTAIGTFRYTSSKQVARR